MTPKYSFNLQPQDIDPKKLKLVTLPKLDQTVFHAKTKKVSFAYPSNWWHDVQIHTPAEGINETAEFGGVVPKVKWESMPGASVGLWFSLEDGIGTAEGDKLAQLVSAKAIVVPGFNQQTYYTETVCFAADGKRFISNFGLISHPEEFNVNTYLIKYPHAHSWNMSKSLELGSSFLSFHGSTYGSVTAEVDKAFPTLEKALAFFKSAQYHQAKQIVLSVSCV